MPVPWIDIYYKNENIKKYSKIMEEVCREQNILFSNYKLSTSLNYGTLLSLRFNDRTQHW
jgi:hypothetical protein